jgi:hypothetical protein
MHRAQLRGGCCRMPVRGAKRQGQGKLCLHDSRCVFS